MAAANDGTATWRPGGPGSTHQDEKSPSQENAAKQSCSAPLNENTKGEAAEGD